LAVGASTGASAQAISGATGIFNTGVFTPLTNTPGTNTAGPAGGPGAQSTMPAPPGGLAAPGAEPIIDTRDFSVVPIVGLQETFTDNALVSPTNKEYDFITRPMVGGDFNLRGGPATATVSGHVFYDAYANHPDLSGVSGDASGTGSYSLIPSFLSIDADGVLTNGELSTFGAPALDRVGPENRVQVATYDVGPHLTTTLDDFADVDAAARFAQVFFENPNENIPGIPTDSTILTGAATMDTGTRFAGYQSITQGNAVKDDHGFEAYSGEQSFFVRLLPDLRVVGRGGYDDVRQPGVIDISAPMWSGGLEYSLNTQSSITIERGERYNHVAWAGEVHLQLSDALFAEGRYDEQLAPEQIQLNSSFLNFAAPSTTTPIELTPNSFTVNGNLDNQTSLNKTAQFRLVYVWPTQQISFDATWNDRLLIVSNQHDRNVESGINYIRNIAPDLAFSTSVMYWRTFSNPFFGASELYNGEVGLQYTINPQMRLVGGYAYQRQTQLFVGGQSITENVAFAAISRTF
jgi:uncharacterized protein (PEP-CTERM system associated)